MTMPAIESVDGLRKAALAAYITVDSAVADDIAARFKWAANEIERLLAAAERVCAFDWSSNNDADAVATIDELRRIIQQQARENPK